MEACWGAAPLDLCAVLLEFSWYILHPGKDGVRSSVKVYTYLTIYFYSTVHLKPFSTSKACTCFSVAFFSNQVIYSNVKIAPLPPHSSSYSSPFFALFFPFPLPTTHNWHWWEQFFLFCDITMSQDTRWQDVAIVALMLPVFYCKFNAENLCGKKSCPCLCQLLVRQEKQHRALLFFQVGHGKPIRTSRVVYFVKPCSLSFPSSPPITTYLPLWGQLSPAFASFIRDNMSDWSWEICSAITVQPVAIYPEVRQWGRQVIESMNIVPI